MPVGVDASENVGEASALRGRLGEGDLFQKERSKVSAVVVLSTPKGGTAAHEVAVSRDCVDNEPLEAFGDRPRQAPWVSSKFNNGRDQTILLKVPAEHVEVRETSDGRDANGESALANHATIA